MSWVTITVVVPRSRPSALSIDAVEDIATVEDVDALFVGPVDLALSLRVPMRAPEVEAAIARILAAARAADLPCGFFVPNGAAAARRAADGFTWFIVGSDHSHYQTRLRVELARAAEAQE